jgi:hypothetical protein
MGRRGPTSELELNFIGWCWQVSTKTEDLLTKGYADGIETTEWHRSTMRGRKVETG